jgi:hypothetical protein
LRSTRLAAEMHWASWSIAATILVINYCENRSRQGVPLRTAQVNHPSVPGS